MKSLEMWTGRVGHFTHIYLLLCDNGGKIVAKIGVSDFPMKRLETHKTSCPFRIKVIASAPVSSRKTAFKIESAVMAMCAPWRTNGEWFQFDQKDKQAFNAILREAFQTYEPTRPLKWSKIDLPNVGHTERAKHFFAKNEFQRRCQRRPALASKLKDDVGSNPPKVSENV